MFIYLQHVNWSYIGYFMMNYVSQWAYKKFTLFLGGLLIYYTALIH